MADSIRVKNERAKQLEDSGFEIYRGWSEELAEQLVKGSQEPEMLRWVPRDASERFTDIEAANEWFNANRRIVYALSRKAFSGVIWFSKVPKEEYDAHFTLAIRMYEDARGQGMAKPFMASVHEDFEHSLGQNDSIWLATGKDNLSAQKLYENQGYVKREETPDGRVIMVRRPITRPTTKQ